MCEGRKDGKATILIVDDDARSVRGIQEGLERLGFPVAVAPSKEVALEALATCMPDLMVLDLEEPRLQGHEILATIRAGDETRHLPVIALARGATAGPVAEQLQSDADDFIRKPVNVEELVARINLLLRIGRIRREAIARNRDLETLSAIATSLNHPLNLKEMLEQTLLQALDLIGMHAGVIHLSDEGDQRFTICGGEGLFAAQLEEVGSVRLCDEFANAVAHTQSPILIRDMAAESVACDATVRIPGVHAAAGIPLIANRVVGTMSLFGRHPRVFSPEEERMLAGLGHQIGMAIENARLFEETRGALARSNLLYELSNQLHSMHNFEDTLQFAVRQVLEVFEADGAVISLRDVERGRGEVIRIGIYPSGRQGSESAAGFDAVAQAVVDAGRPILVPCAGAAPGHSPALALEEGVEALLAVPVQGMSGCHGAVALSYRRPREFRPLEVETLLVYASHLGIGLENATSFRRLQKHAAQLSDLHKATLLVSGSLDLNETLALIVQTAVQASGGSSSNIVLPEKDGTLAFAALHDPNGHFAEPIEVRADGISRAVLDTGRIWMSADFGKEPSGRVNPDLIRSGKRAAICLPLHMKGRDKGVMWVHYDHPRSFDEEDVHLLSALANQAAIAIENARLFQETSRLAFTDGLTDLFNHRHFYQQLEQEFKRAQRYDRPLSLIMLDLDFFKRYNDLYGHLVGDRALRLIADGIRGNTRTTDVVARYGGDEFGIILPETDLNQAWVQAERIRGAMERSSPETLGKTWDSMLTLSLGVACIGPGMRQAEDLIRAADKALYRSKAAGGNLTSLG